MKAISLISILSIVMTISIDSQAAPSRPKPSNSDNSFLFIENNIDKEFFIAAESLDQRFSGSNVWTTYQSNQTSLGYIGRVNWLDNATSLRNVWKDMWFENSPINSPFTGIRCRSGGACPAQGYYGADSITAEGFSHAKIGGGGISGGGYGFASLSNNAYEYFRQMPTNSSQTFLLNYCSTTNNYDPSKGERCNTTPNGNWESTNFTLTKLGHLTLVDTHALTEIFVASDGTPSLGLGSMECRIGIVSGASGVICKLVDYQYQTTSKPLSIRFGMAIDTGLLGFTPGTITRSPDLLYSGNQINWYKWNADVPIKDILFNNSNGIYLFLSKNFLKNLVNHGITPTASAKAFTFTFTNKKLPESGFYGFTPSNTLIIKPRNYGISIISDEFVTKPSKEGRVGENEKPIEFGYIVTTSGPRQANTITAQVIGNGTSSKGVGYCLFTSDDKKITVPFRAFLEYTDKSGSKTKKSNGCVEPPIDITNALWSETPWDAPNQNEGRFYRTNLKLLFPMNDSSSFWTSKGVEWIGTVSGKGIIEVKATWTGADIH